MNAGEDGEKREHLHTAGTVWTRFKKKRKKNKRNTNHPVTG